MKWTDAQLEAIQTTGEDLCVTASAGSGKTAVLVERVLHLVRECRVPLDRIVAITFTEKAAAEMKDRATVYVLVAVVLVLHGLEVAGIGHDACATRGGCGRPKVAGRLVGHVFQLPGCCEHALPGAFGEGAAAIEDPAHSGDADADFQSNLFDCWHRRATVCLRRLRHSTS